MNYQDLQKELLVTIRGTRSQGKINQLLGVSFNQAHRWESGKTQVGWKSFVEYCNICRVKLKIALSEAFSFKEDPNDTAALVSHFVGSNKKNFVAESLGVSRTTVSRWMSGALTPTLLQMLALMDFGSADFFRFIELLTGSATLPSIQEKLDADRRQLEMFYTYPWLSALLSAIDLEDYRKNPTEAFLAKKSKLPLKIVKETIGALEKENLLQWNGKHWETHLKRTGIRGSLEGKKKIARYVFGRTLEAMEASFGSTNSRFSWKLFSLNKNQYETILQKYTEFFNELGTLIDNGQKGADKVYLFSVGLIDFDEIPEMKGPITPGAS